MDDFGIWEIDCFNVAIICNESPCCAWAMDLIRPFDASDALIPVLADVFAIVTTNCHVGSDKEYDGRVAVSITRRVLLPG